MGRQQERVLLSWSGGKESIMVLRELLHDRDVQVAGLLAIVADGRVTKHGIGEDVLMQQAAALRLPLEVVYVPCGTGQAEQVEPIGRALARYRDAEVRKVAFGDLFLDDIRDFREECLEALGMEAVFPLWLRCTKDLAWSFINERFKAVVTGVDTCCLTPEFAGRPFDRALLADLPLEVDPCGENGEFHTFVYDGPLFHHPVPIKLGEPFRADGLHFCEVLARSKRPVAAGDSGIRRKANMPRR